MPTLDWIGKQAVVNHHREVPYRLIHCDKELSAGDAEAGNLLVQGDNLQALRALLPYYAGKVKCIYIDPPYNTGNEGWVYNDNVNSPEIRKWLGEVVGKEAEDLSRHDKWLCMMYPRLRLLREFLREDGVIFVSIDDDENHRLRMILDEIFGVRNFVATFAWQKKQSPQNDAISVSDMHDYVVCYAKKAALSREDTSGFRANRLQRTDVQDGRFKNPDDDPRGPWFSADYTCAKSADERPNLYYSIINPNTGEEIWPSRTRVWGYSKDEHERHCRENLIYWGADGKGRPRLKKFLKNGMNGVVPSTWLTREECGDNQEARREIRAILSGTGTDFETPKPTRLILRILEIATGPNDLILDSFAGSGTTGHAVLDLNKQDGGHRRFILVEMEGNVAKDVTAERLRRVIEGYNKGGDPEKPVEGLGGGFRFCRLGTPLFDEFGDIAGEVTFPDLAAHIFFSETGVPIPERATGPLLGTHQGKAVYLLFDPASAQAPRAAAGNVLTPDKLAELPDPPEGFEGVRVVYAEGCTVSPERLKAAGVVFRQIPYQVEGAA
ncbi:site-specific DNA-methyltransferase (adenine-specific)/adenine-specific DNA-methyltransferase [Albidovulum inexpectatum]|uniref:site-specific DNA-methyltransferase (adenine-specific) n=1 Tax=Albidovulum inexpectatum TaxID=196587 RepID=A0A2S5JEK4_9RHOB|nr:site-specific DNA-methyltransferase [Albidovulum inexpectatum]PPB79952.1 site-specific DNA-methyltransferase (adenine-specific)/adenine-specific DNA-methyltransferase [Albidovulum inexpectatum]